VPRRAAIRSGRDAAAVGGADWQQADSRGSGRGYCAHGSVIPRDPQVPARGTRQPSELRWTASVCLCVCRLRHCYCGMSRWSRVSFDGSGVVWLHACRGRPAANPVMLRRPIVSIKRIKETVELHRRYEF
jgi:hypothetical protein